MLVGDFLLVLLFYPEDRSDTFLRNVGGLLQNYEELAYSLDDPTSQIRRC
jgi:hypothetical protein